MKRIIILTITIFFTISGIADEWEKPRIQEVYSQNGLYCLIIYPKQISKRNKTKIYVGNEIENKTRKQIDSIIPCHAELYRTGKFYLDRKLLWKKNLKNEIAPNTAAVTNDGKYVITFDDWGALGYGDNVMVVYNEKGEFLNNYTLNKLNTFKRDQLETSVSSIWWFQGIETYSIEPERISILIKDKDFNIRKRLFNLNELKFEE